MDIRNHPVVFVHSDIIALTAARDLAQFNVKVYGADHERGIATYSRYVEHVRVADFRSDPQGFKSDLIALGRSINQKVPIFPTSDAVLGFLIKHKAEFGNYFLLPWSEQVIQRIVDKWNLINCAQACGVPIPRTLLVDTSHDLASQIRNVEYPAIIKPVSSKDWSTQLRQATGIHKVVKVDSELALLSTYAKIKQFNERVLIQEFIPGEDTNIQVFASLFDGETDIASFAGRKILQHPEGITAIVEPVRNDTIRRLSLRLLRKLSYRGLSEIEFKKDVNSGKYKLIEINPRHWVWHQLGTANGINMTWIYYNYLMDKPIEHVSDFRPRVKWVDDTKILSLVVDLLRGRSATSMRELLKMLKRPLHIAVFSVRDPLPFIMFACRSIYDPIARRVRRLIGHDRNSASVR